MPHFLIATGDQECTLLSLVPVHRSRENQIVQNQVYEECHCHMPPSQSPATCPLGATSGVVACKEGETLICKDLPCHVLFYSLSGWVEKRRKHAAAIHLRPTSRQPHFQELSFQFFKKPACFPCYKNGWCSNVSLTLSEREEASFTSPVKTLRETLISWAFQTQHFRTHKAMFDQYSG